MHNVYSEDEEMTSEKTAIKFVAVTFFLLGATCFMNLGRNWSSKKFLSLPFQE